MNNNKLSNTDMLKAAARWDKLLRAGKLTPKSIDKLYTHSLHGSEPYSKFNESSLRLFSHDMIQPHNYREFIPAMRAGLSGIEPITTTAARKKFINDIYKPSFTQITREKRDRTLNSLINNLNEEKREAATMTSSWLQRLFKTPNNDADILKLINDHSKEISSLNIFKQKNLVGRYNAGTLSNYSPSLRQINVSRQVPKEFKSMVTRHEGGHAFHDIANEKFRPDVVRHTLKITNQNPGLLKVLIDSHKPGVYSTYMDEVAAQLIASSGKSRGAKKFIDNFINYGRVPVGSVNSKFRRKPEGMDNMINSSLKQDPSGRAAASLVQLHKNHKLPVPLKYQFPELFNPNPYLP
jgi:hypothetical protein